MASATDLAMPDSRADLRAPRPLMVVDNAHVTYRVYASGKPSNARDNSFSLKAMRGGQSLQEIHAVRGVSFTASEGETIGVVGHNGSGKSTLFRAMSGLLPTSEGTIWAADRPVLLGVNAALMPELSGENNIKLGLLAMGFSQEEAAAQVGPIADFAELNEFIYHPMRTYSSGMSARLKFAIASAKTHSILLIDEALSVGDRRFKQKSDERIRTLRDDAGLVMIVSHSAGALRDTCDRVLWIHKGELRADGDAKDVINEYSKWTKNPGAGAVGAASVTPAKAKPKVPEVAEKGGLQATTEAVDTAPGARKRANATARRERNRAQGRQQRRRRVIAFSVTGGALILAVGAGAAISVAANQADRTQLTELRASASAVPRPSVTPVLPVIADFTAAATSVVCATSDEAAQTQLAWTIDGAKTITVLGPATTESPAGAPLLTAQPAIATAQAVPFSCAAEAQTYTIVAENTNGQQVTSTITVARQLTPAEEPTEETPDDTGTDQPTDTGTDTGTTEPTTPVEPTTPAEPTPEPTTEPTTVPTTPVDPTDPSTETPPAQVDPPAGESTESPAA